MDLILIVNCLNSHCSSFMYAIQLKIIKSCIIYQKSYFFKIFSSFPRFIFFYSALYSIFFPLLSGLYSLLLYMTLPFYTQGELLRCEFENYEILQCVLKSLINRY